MSGRRGDGGEALSERYCKTCHVKPLPEHLDKATWVAKVFPIMRKYMGMDALPQRDQLPHDLKAFYPAFPTMTEDEWYTVAQWYIDNAPSVLPGPPPVVVSGVTPLFNAVPIVQTVDLPLTTLARFDIPRHRMIIGDGLRNALFVTDIAGITVARVALGGPPSSVDIQADAWYVTDMGQLLPHDSAIGKLVKVTWINDKPTSTVLLDSLRRPAHVTVVDLNNDGRKDFLMCEYGNLIGQFGWYEINAKGTKKYHLLAPLPGAIRAVVRDMNGDKKPDIVVQMAQAREGLFVYINGGKGRFTAKELLTFPPCFGSSSFSFTDTDGDGQDEVVITTGDNGDYENPPFKPYHGIYVFANDGRGRYVQSSFQRLDGAYGAIIRDFDGDGARDMLSYSYFPRFDRGDIDQLRFDSRFGSTSPITWRVQGADQGRWLVSDVGDVDGDGDDDVFLGNVSMGPGVVPETIAKRWMSNNTVAMFLRNTKR
ncbi:MAG: VCBS repeat-containing protein [Candidatus Kapabacteria bacterium]|nr:VCBS repeat-containing protein [Candidatus Kapabacteria bacterium]